MTEYQIPMWRCPGCGKDFPCIKVADSLVPIVPLLVPTFEPVARMFGADNQPLARPLPELIATSQWRASLRVVPHELVCAALARTRGKTLPPLACSALPAPLPGAQPPNVDTETPQDGPQREVKAPGIDFQTEGNPTPAGGDAPDDPRGAQPQ